MKEKTRNRSQLGKRIRFEIFDRDNFTCQYCGRMPPDVMLEVDHIIPVSKGGSNEPENLRTSCAACNRGKSDKQLNQEINPIESARRSQEAMEAVHTAKVFAKASKAREQIRQKATNQICEALQKSQCYKANVTSFILAVERFGAEMAFYFLDRSICTMARGSPPDEDNVFRYFNGCIKRAVESEGARQ
jgi:hypothetical protein